ncbi:Tim44 domain-containing protein [Ensifer soli]|uniref:Tim44 domain-containing protein n=1 Tax=Ciceribacter sp. sgz301302 TaxID=3342379 RepID=UPI0035B7CAF7
MRQYGRVFAAVALALVTTLAAVDFAEARRAGGGLGSRGSRTFSAPPVTRTAPNTATPIDRTMTQQPQQATRPAAQQQPQAANRSGGLFGGFGRSMLGGLFVGGLIGMLLGNGLGGAFGFLGLLLQVGLVVLAVMLLMRLFGRRQQPAYAGGRAPAAPGAYARQPSSAAGGSPVPIPGIGGGRAAPAAAPQGPADEIGLSGADFDRFEAMLGEVQQAYAREDYAALRRLTTPEAMSYLAEELSENATKGLINEVGDVRLVQGDLAEAWREGPLDYATVAMRYESIDVTRERSTGRVVAGDAQTPTEAVELWTFVRRAGTDWQVSAIQSAA